jgi:hypothetical protein
MTITTRRSTKTAQPDAKIDKAVTEDDEIVSSNVQDRPGYSSHENQAQRNLNVSHYIENCKKFDLFVDPNVVIALQTGWDKMQPSKKFGEGELLSLIDVLDKNDHIKKLNLASITMHDSRLRAGGNGNSNARVLNFILRENKSIESLDLSNTGLDDDGMHEICEVRDVKNYISLRIKLLFTYSHMVLTLLTCRG